MRRFAGWSSIGVFSVLAAVGAGCSSGGGGTGPDESDTGGQDDTGAVTDTSPSPDTFPVDSGEETASETGDDAADAGGDAAEAGDDAADAGDAGDAAEAGGDASDSAMAEAGDAGDGGDAAEAGDGAVCGTGLTTCATSDAGSVCVDTNTDPSHCGDCMTACAALPNATPGCAAAMCGIGACNAGFANCDSNAANGCELNVSSDVNNCGACGKVCSLAHAVSGCASSACTVSSCVQDATGKWSDCDLAAANGCESDVNTDPNNCGACGTVCTLAHATPKCVTATGSSTCQIATCSAGYVDLDKSPTNGCEYACTVVAGADAPDPTFADTNCDGIDGDLAHAVFVSSRIGNDTTGDGTMAKPYKTLQLGINQAYTAMKDVYVDAGTYNESIQLASGVNVFGGFDSGTPRAGAPAGYWGRGAGLVTKINGGTLAVAVSSLNAATMLDYVTVTSADGSSSSSGPGGSSVAIMLSASGSYFTLRGSDVTAGNGGSGGAAGTAAAGSSGNSGITGGVGLSNGGTGSCAAHVQPTVGSAGAASACAPAGGAGGVPGSGVAAGTKGGDASMGGGGGGGGTAPSTCTGSGTVATVGGVGINGTSGTSGGAGAAGTGGTGTGTWTAGGLWTTSNGGAGTVGNNGTSGGGGGGGGGGGTTTGITGCCQSWGGAGGGGGSGGCGGAGGAGGFGGGASFGILLVDSTATLTNDNFTTKNGGGGGSGAFGGTGGTGGTGASGGAGTGSSGAGGGGGNGGNGGTGGNGGGGGGGPSICIAYHASSGSPTAPTVTGGTQTSGTGGTGGAGFPSSGAAGASGKQQAL
jgi:hypothetical protein